MIKTPNFFETLRLINRVRNKELKAAILGEFAQDPAFRRAIREIICNLAMRKRKLRLSASVKKFNGDLLLIIQKKGRKSQKVKSMRNLGPFIKLTFPAIIKLLK